MSASQRLELTWQGAHRRALLHLPAGAGPLPLVVALHGTGGTPRLMAAITGFNRLADAEGFAVLYPQALGEPGTEDPGIAAAWNAGEGCGCPAHAAADDLGFLRALIGRLVERGVADPARVYVAGLSNGGRMAYRLALEAADLVAAIAVVGGAWDGRGAPPARPVPTLVLHGTADQHIPYAGGRGLKGRPLEHLPVPETIRRWVGLMGLAAKPRRRYVGACFCDTAAEGGVEVALWTLPGGGHAWPGGRPWSQSADRPMMELSATEEIWGFCRRFRVERG